MPTEGLQESVLWEGSRALCRGIRITQAVQPQRCTYGGVMFEQDKGLHSSRLRPPGMSQELFVQPI